MNRVSDTIRNAFYERTDGYGLCFYVNDPVRIKGETGSKAAGSIISLEQLEPEQYYLVEYLDGTDDVLSVTQLQNDDET